MKRSHWVMPLFVAMSMACGEGDPEGSAGVGGQGGESTGGTGGTAGTAGSETGGAGGSNVGGTAGESDVNNCETGGVLSEPLVEDALAVFVTSDDLASDFEPYAHLHTLTGIATKVVTTKQICAGQCNDDDPRQDTAAHIKQWLMGQPGLRYVILAGGFKHVPSRLVHDTYKNPFLTTYKFEEEFYTDYYFADFSEWDGNGDGIYAQDGVDHPDYRPEIAVSRILSSTSQEASVYLEKVRRYLTEYPSAHVTDVLFLSNVATQFLGLDIDGAWYFEADGRTRDLLPAGSVVRRLYATGMEGAEKNNVALQIDAIEQGSNLIVHSGHGSVHSLTVEYTGGEKMTAAMAYGLKNSVYPIFLSSACEAGTFAVPNSAAERLMNAPEGGAIAYLGNSATGLGLAGGMQLIDEMLRYIQLTDYPLLGDALLVGHENMPEKDTFITPVGGIALPVVDKDSYEWTQKSATMFGDILIPVWKGGIEPAPEIDVVWERTCEGRRVEVTVSPPVNGSLRVHAGAYYYEVQVKNGKASLHVEAEVGPIEVGLALPGHRVAIDSF